MEHFQYGKQIGKILDIQNKQKRHRAPKHILLGLKSEKSGNQVPNVEFVEEYLKFAHEISVHNGSDAFPKRAHEVPNRSNTDLGEQSEAL